MTMQRYAMPEWVKQRILRRRPTLFAHSHIPAKKSALIVIDMQNYFCAPGQPNETPAAREIVGNINRMASRMREAGGSVVWIQTSSARALERWANHHRHLLSEERGARRLAGLAEGSEGFALYPGLDARRDDLYVKKATYSALIRDSSTLEDEVRRRGVESLLIAGTTTNVCCESTARDAMLLDYRVVVLSDATAATTLEEHVGSLNNIALFFGDVMTVDEAAERLVKE
jgi:ureidoacrylate peracid hydrolase